MMSCVAVWRCALPVWRCALPVWLVERPGLPADRVIPGYLHLGGSYTARGSAAPGHQQH